LVADAPFCPLNGADWGIVNPWLQGDEIAIKALCSPGKQTEKYLASIGNYEKRGQEEVPAIVQRTVTVNVITLSSRIEQHQTSFQVRYVYMDVEQPFKNDANILTWLTSASDMWPQTRQLSLVLLLSHIPQFILP
jgi:hypothetical protein